VFELPGQDSNLDKESQNLLCYRYTTGYNVNSTKDLSFPTSLVSYAVYHWCTTFCGVPRRTTEIVAATCKGRKVRFIPLPPADIPV
jgi:hypothetical protein